MANAYAVTLQQRLIAIKTGFEGLLETSRSRLSATRLRELFERATATHLKMLPWAGILWSPRERTDLQRTYTRENGSTGNDTRTELEDWFMTLATVRNSIIHDGVISMHEYSAPVERPHSRYSGHLLWIGERILREAIKAKLGGDILLCGRIAERARLDSFLEEHADELVQLFTSRDQAHTVEPSPEEQPRSLEVLLTALACGDARQVQLRRSLVGGPSRSRIPENGGVFRTSWTAEAHGPKVQITEADRSVLLQAGAEDELDDHVELCD
jgi:hypothetical protein